MKLLVDKNEIALLLPRHHPKRMFQFRDMATKQHMTVL